VAEDQLAFFDMPPPAQPAMMTSAVIVADWRFELKRIWDESLPMLVVCMLNPSTADANKNDPTILTLIHFAKLWGYGGLWVVNLFAYRSSSPAEMMANNPVETYGEDGNQPYLLDAIGYAKAHGRSVLVAWGNHGSHCGADRDFTKDALQRGVDLVCLGTTLSGHPKHPLARGKHRVPRDQQPIIWRSAA
jgi:hypothetical protein